MSGIQAVTRSTFHLEVGRNQVSSPCVHAEMRQPPGSASIPMYKTAMQTENLYLQAHVGHGYGERPILRIFRPMQKLQAQSDSLLDPSISRYLTQAISGKEIDASCP